MHRRGRTIFSRILWAAVASAVLVPMAGGQPLLVLSEEEPSVQVGRYTSILRDEARAWSIRDVTGDSLSRKFVANHADVPVFGYSPASYWIRLRVVRTSTASDDWYLSLDNRSIDHVELFVPDGGGRYSYRATGDAHPFHTREIPERHFVFALSVPDTVMVVHLRVASSGPIYLPIRLLSTGAFVADIRRAHFRLGALFGLLVILALFHLVFYVTIRDTTYLIYVAFLAALILYNLSVERLAFQYFWPNNIWLADRSSSMLGLVCLVTGIVFTRRFLDTRTSLPRWDYVLRAAAAGCGALFVVFLFSGLSRNLAITTNIFFVLVVSLILLSTIAGVHRRQPASKVFLVAWVFLLGGTAISMLGNLSVLPPAQFAGGRGIQAGSAITLTFFAAALGQRQNLMRKAREDLRIRIANDLHDDIGAGLTQIALTGYLIRQHVESGEISRLAREIEDQARGLTDSVRDVVWTVSPTRESWQDLEERMRDLAAGLLGPAGIAVDLRGESLTDSRPLPLDVRQHVLHTFKETAHNVVKHAQCGRFEARWSVDARSVWMRMQDDGVGFVPAEARYGHGLQSLRRRVRDAKGTLTIESAPGEGTVVELMIPIS